MAFNDKSIISWSPTQANNDPKGTDNVQSDLARQFRSIKSVFVKDVSRRKQFLTSNPVFTLATDVFSQKLTLTGNWLSYLTPYRKLWFYKYDDNSDFPVGVTGIVGTGAVYATGSPGKTTVTVWMTSTTIPSEINAMAFAVESRSPTVLPFQGASGTYIFTATGTASERQTATVSLQTHADAATLDKYDCPSFIPPSDQGNDTGSYKYAGSDSFIAAEVVRHNLTAGTDETCCVIESVGSLNFSAFSAFTKMTKPTFTVKLAAPVPDGESVWIDWSLYCTGRQIPISGTQGRNGIYNGS